MNVDELHDLAAAYALGALDDAERLAYETHLETCKRCQDEVASLQDAATSLAYAVPAAAPPAGLRDRIVAVTANERSNVVSLRPRRLTFALGGLAAAAATVALVIGIWAAGVHSELDRERSVTEILGDPAARTLALDGTEGRLVVTETGEAALVARLRPAPAGKTYEVWVFEDGTPRPAGLFDGRGARDVVRLTRQVPSGGKVAVTLEEEGGVDEPTTPPLVTTDAV